MNKTETRRTLKVRVELLVRFLSDCWWFAKVWEPVEIKFYGVVRTKFLWSMAHKRHAVKVAITKRKSNDLA